MMPATADNLSLPTLRSTMTGAVHPRPLTILAVVAGVTPAFLATSVIYPSECVQDMQWVRRRSELCSDGRIILSPRVITV